MDILQEPVLVLNKGWSPIAVTIARDAISDLVANTITAIDPDTYATYTFEDWVERGVKPGALALHSQHLAVEIPQVIILSYYDRIPQRCLNYSKDHIFKRDRFTCCYCGAQPGSRNREHPLTIDHVKPRSQGGVTSWENCVTACEDCNGKKADRTPEQAGMALRTYPSMPRWTMDQSIRRLAAEKKQAWQKFIKV